LRQAQLAATISSSVIKPRRSLVERQLLKAILNVAAGFVERRVVRSGGFSDLQIVRVFYWAVLYDRPMSWACDREHWPLWDWRESLPSASTMSRRLRSPSVLRLLATLEQHVTRPSPDDLTPCWIIDGKPLLIGGASQDRQAGYGRAAASHGKGYKIHALISPQGKLAAWRLAPMNKDERVMARRMLRTAPISGYVLADGFYDDNHLHAVCDKNHLQLITPRRYPKAKGVGRHKHSPGRLRSLQLIHPDGSGFGWQLLAERDRIERYYGQLTGCAAGLTHLPPWVRTYKRVHRWVQAKLTLHALRHTSQTTYRR
jgi:hypothetical protein